MTNTEKVNYGRKETNYCPLYDTYGTYLQIRIYLFYRKAGEMQEVGFIRSTRERACDKDLHIVNCTLLCSLVSMKNSIITTGRR